MKVLFQPSDKLTFEIEGAGQKEIFKGLAMVQEVFSEKKCGVCGSENIKFVVRKITQHVQIKQRCTYFNVQSNYKYKSTTRY